MTIRKIACGRRDTGSINGHVGHIIALFAALLLSATSVHAKDLYVDGTAGNDNVSYAENSASNPWSTVGRAVWGSSSRTNPNSSQAAQAGDVVIVRAGTYQVTQGTGERYEPIYNPVNSGSAGRPITIRAEGLVTLRSNTSGAGEPIVGTLERNHIVWDGFYIDERNVNTKSDTGPIVVWQSDDIVIQNFTVEGYNSGWVDNHNAIRLEHANEVVIRNNVLRGYSESQNGMNASVITAYYTGTARIENNEISDANTGIFVKGLNTGPFTIRYNRITNVRSAIQFGGIGISSGSNGAVVYSNIIENGWAGVGFIGYDSVSPANVTVANNTIINVGGSDGGALLFRPNSIGYRNLNFHNNIIVNSDHGISAWHNDVDDLTFSHNNYDNVGTVAYVEWSPVSLTSWQIQYGKDIVGSMVQSSLFANLNNGDYHLQGGSLLTRAGLDVLDLNGNGSTNDAIAIGAYARGDEIIGLSSIIAEPPPAAKTPSPPILQ